MRITGRVKDIFKTSKGKYVAPSPIEMKLLANKNWEQICLVGAGIPQPIALVVLSERGKVKSKESLKESLVRSLEIINPKLDSHEKLKSIVVLADDWTIENKLLTPTMKIKRNAIEKLHKNNYVDWFEGSEIVFV